MQTTFQRGSFITRRIHPLAVRFQTGESGIDQAIRQSQRIAFDGEIAINTPIFFAPIASTLRSEAVSPASHGS